MSVFSLQVAGNFAEHGHALSCCCSHRQAAADPVHSGRDTGTVERRGRLPGLHHDTEHGAETQRPEMQGEVERPGLSELRVVEHHVERF